MQEQVSDVRVYGLSFCELTVRYLFRALARSQRDAARVHLWYLVEGLESPAPGLEQVPEDPTKTLCEQPYSRRATATQLLCTMAEELVIHGRRASPLEAVKLLHRRLPRHDADLRLAATLLDDWLILTKAWEACTSDANPWAIHEPETETEDETED